MLHQELAFTTPFLRRKFNCCSGVAQGVGVQFNPTVTLNTNQFPAPIVISRACLWFLLYSMGTWSINLANKPELPSEIYFRTRNICISSVVNNDAISTSTNHWHYRETEPYCKFVARTISHFPTNRRHVASPVNPAIHVSHTYGFQ